MMDCEILRMSSLEGTGIYLRYTKIMAVRREVMAEDRTPPSIHVVGEEIEAVSEFPYIGSQIESSGRMTLEVEKRTVTSTTPQNGVFQACVLSALLYG